MALDEVRERLRRKLEEVVGVEEADLLMDRPPGGWGELVTKDWLHLELGVIESRIDAFMAVTEARFVGVDTRFVSLDARFDSIDTRFDSIDTRFDLIDTRFDLTNTRLDALDARLDRQDRRFESIDAAIRGQTWKLVGAMTGLFAAFVAAIKL